MWLHPTDDANAVLEAWLGGLDAERFETWLDRAAQNTGGPGDERTLDQKRADIVADLLLGRRSLDDLDHHAPDGGSGDEPTSPAGATTGPTTTTTGTATGAVIGVTVPIESLVGLSDDPGITWATKTSLPAEVVRELAVEPGTLFYRIFTDPAGGVLDVTELGRFPSHKLTTALRFRDQVCRVAHCDIPAIRCDKDHHTPHPEGATTGSNLIHLCRRHHRLKTYGRLRATMLGPPPELHAFA